ncbi:MAG: hypothetical protein WCQ55_04540, partial [Paludibacteraceae bacterium]
HSCRIIIVKFIVSKEPPYAERHVRWCERSHRELIPMLLLDCFLSQCSKMRTDFFVCQNANAVITLK